MRIALTIAISLFLSFVLLLFAQVPILTVLLLCLAVFCVLFWMRPKLTLALFSLFLLAQGELTYWNRAGIIYNLDELALICMALLLTARKLVLREPFRRTAVDLPLILLLLIGVVSSVVGGIVSMGVAAGGLLLFVKGFIMFYLFANLDVQEQDIGRFKTFLYGVGVFAVAYAVLGVLWPGVFLRSVRGIVQYRFGLPALQSFLGHPGSFSAFMGVLACSAAVDGLTKRQGRYAGLFALFLTGVIFSLRRTTLVGVIVACVGVLLSGRVRRAVGRGVSIRLLGILVTVCVVCSGVLLVAYRDLGSYLHGESPRSVLLTTGLKIAADYFPLGSGFGTYSGGMNQHFYSPLFYRYRISGMWGLSESNPTFVNDTFWPHIIAETGAFGLLCYLLVIAGFFRIAFRALRGPAGRETTALAITAVMLLILSLVESTKGTFYEMTLWTFFYFGGVGVLQSWRAPAEAHDHLARE